MAKRKKGYRRVYDEGTGKTKLGRRKEVDVYRPLTGVGKTLVKDITYKSDDSPRVKYTEREVTRRNKDGSVKSYKNIVRKNGKIVDEATTKKIKYKDGGPKVKQRRGVRENPDGSVSSHLMRAEYIPEKGWVAFPSLFQDSKPYADDQQNWVDMSEEEDWMKIYEEAERRGEVYEFGEDKEAALAFGMGSWKDQLPDEGIEIELNDEEAEKYRAGGYVLEELEEGGEDDVIRAQKTCPPLHIYDSKSQKCVLMTETQLAEYELKYIKDWADSPQHKSMLKKSLTKDYPNASDQEIESYVNNVKNLRQKVVNPVMTFDYDDPDDPTIAYTMPILFQDYYNYVTDSEGNLISSDDDGNFDLANPNLSNPKAFMSALYSENDSMSPYLYDWNVEGKSVLIDKKTGEKIEGVDPNKIPNPNFLAKAHFNTLGSESNSGTYAHEFSHLQKMADDLIPKSDKLKIDNYSNVDKVYEGVSDNVESIKKEYNPKGLFANMYLSDKDLYENNFDKFKIVSIIGKRLKKENSNVNNTMPYDEFIKKYSKDDDFYSDGERSMLDIFTYVARPAETVARLDAIRMFGKASGIYDPMTEPLTKVKFNKLLKFLEKIETKANPNQFRDLLEIYTKDQIFDMLNNISKNEETDNVLDDQYAQLGGFIEAELSDEEVERYRAGGYVLEEMHKGGEPGHIHDPLMTYDPNDPKNFDSRYHNDFILDQGIDNTANNYYQVPTLNLNGTDPDAEYNQWVANKPVNKRASSKSLLTHMAEGIMGIPELLTETIPNYIAETAEDAYDQFSKTSIVPSNINEGLDDLYHLPANLLAEDYSSYSTRDKAFAQARADGETSFMYKGKRFNTRREDDDIKLTFETDDPDEQYVFQYLTDKTKKEHPILWNLMNKASGIDKISFDGVGSRWMSSFDENSMQEKNRGYYHEGLGLGDGAAIHVGETPFEDGTNDEFINVLIAELAHRTGHQPSNNPFQGITHKFKSVYENIKYGDEKRYQTPGTDEFNNHRLTEPGIHMTVRGKMTPAIVKKVQNFLGVEEDGIFGEDTYLTMVDRFKDNELIKQMLERYAKRNPKDKHPELPIRFGEDALWANYLNLLSAHVPELSKSTGSWKPYVETVQNMGDEFIIPFTKESFKDRKITDFNIRELQSFLAQQGYELPNSVVSVHERYGTLYDGIVGDETKTAFKNYRKKLGYKKQGGFIEAELTPKEVARYVNGGYVLEEMHDGGEPGHTHEEDPPDYDELMKAYKKALADKEAYEKQYALDLKDYEDKLPQYEKELAAYEKKQAKYNKDSDAYKRNRAYIENLKKLYDFFPDYNEIYNSSDDQGRGVYKKEQQWIGEERGGSEWARGSRRADGTRTLQLSPWYAETLNGMLGDVEFMPYGDFREDWDEFYDKGINRSDEFEPIQITYLPKPKKPKGGLKDLERPEYDPPVVPEEPEMPITKLDIIQPELLSNDVELPELEEREEVEGVDYKRKFGMWLEDKAQKDAKLKTFLKYKMPEFFNPKKSRNSQYYRTPKRIRAGFYNEPIEQEQVYEEDSMPMPIFFKDGGSMELDLSPEEVTMYANGGYVVEEIPSYKPGGANDSDNPLQEWNRLQKEKWNGIYEWDDAGKAALKEYNNRMGVTYKPSDHWSAITISNAVMANSGANSRDEIRALGFNPTKSHSSYIADAFKTNRDPDYKYNKYIAEKPTANLDYNVGDILVKGRRRSKKDVGTSKWSYEDFATHGSGYVSHGDIIVGKGTDDKGDYVITAGGNLGDTYKNQKVYVNTIASKYKVKLKDTDFKQKVGAAPSSKNKASASMEKINNVGEDVTVNTKNSSPFSNNFDWDTENDQESQSVSDVSNTSMPPISKFSGSLMPNQQASLFGDNTLGIGYVPYQYQFPEYLGRPQEEEIFEDLYGSPYENILDDDNSDVTNQDAETEDPLEDDNSVVTVDGDKESISSEKLEKLNEEDLKKYAHNKLSISKRKTKHDKFHEKVLDEETKLAIEELENEIYELKKSDVDRANEISKQIKALEEFGDETLNERKELAKERVSILLNINGDRMHSDEYSTTLAIKELKEQIKVLKLNGINNAIDAGELTTEAYYNKYNPGYIKATKAIDKKMKDGYIWVSWNQYDPYVKEEMENKGFPSIMYESLDELADYNYWRDSVKGRTNQKSNIYNSGDNNDVKFIEEFYGDGSSKYGSWYKADDLVKAGGFSNSDLHPEQYNEDGSLKLEYRMHNQNLNLQNSGRMTGFYPELSFITGPVGTLWDAAYNFLTPGSVTDNAGDYAFPMTTGFLNLAGEAARSIFNPTVEEKANQNQWVEDQGGAASASQMAMPFKKGGYITDLDEDEALAYAKKGYIVEEIK